jgi:gamma-glutamylcyclotransferase (GGCT)/AIG2-like uncharacterized protein YtfP
MILYFAYGSNLNAEQMARRCPGARFVGRYELQGWRLVFRKFADIEPADLIDDSVLGGVWEITALHLRALDRFEGHPVTYRRRLMETPFGNAWVYLNQRSYYEDPPPEYVERIHQGWIDCGYL